MAGSKYAYVRRFELPDNLLPGTHIVFRLDGHAFHKFSDEHAFAKPNDLRALELMDHAAQRLMEEHPDILLGFGESDEYSFLLKKSASLYNRRSAKIATLLTSFFTSAYVYHWRDHFPDTPLRYPPSFDGRLVLYPANQHVRDYFSWRQADTHINNMYNTTFWALVQQGGETTTQADATLKGTISSQKQEILFSRFGVNYSKVPERFRKGSVIVRDLISEPQPESNVEGDGGHTHSPRKKRKDKSKPQYTIQILHCDIIKDDFWLARQHLLED
ncbi:tRNAHis guanylyltransferase [Pterulicium gracile]|uniref:tRNA(His) guanylyltransferase n=1 Tax=Pterulicium gracile TaxID=1884261 RepID=A0A5C3QE91_9AGAR|nr:tRNAHis guanylyltransferase [Pterula gracilis]